MHAAPCDQYLAWLFIQASLPYVRVVAERGVRRLLGRINVVYADDSYPVRHVLSK